MTDELAAAILKELRAIREALEGPKSGLIDAAEVAKQTGMSREWVYANADLLGAIRLPSETGQRPRLRFDPATVREALTEPEPPTNPARPNVDLLPIGGKK